jgi:hypothetical protein
MRQLYDIRSVIPAERYSAARVGALGHFRWTYFFAGNLFCRRRRRRDVTYQRHVCARVRARWKAFAGISLPLVRILLVRGMLVGIVAGLLCFAFLKPYGEPQVDQAIAFETLLDKAKAAADKGTGMSNMGNEEPEPVSRTVEASLGLLTGVVVYSTAFGGLFALAFAFVYGRAAGPLSPHCSSALRRVAARPHLRRRSCTEMASQH